MRIFLLLVFLLLAGCAVHRTTEAPDGRGGTKKTNEMRLDAPILWRDRVEQPE